MTTDKLTGDVSVRYAKTQSEVDDATDRNVMVDAVEQVSTEKSMAAMKLRDQGRVAEAHDLLMSNSSFLGTNAAKYKSDRLSRQQSINDDNANNLDERNWQRQRKTQIENNSWSVYQ